ncbi:hypothetical protein FOXG_22297 [Fusarium oxysporum f. sp. lycopersici 4287]|uniref:Uncharacterized protein n=1 Tax=Fusarium oxysporum f. sp. lycopersici (strain 4287 / CBS 123668 / FGSC 9935 / NRRL 34936) TaxID=426428 RepID=A0A0J9W7I5_FUSO4|nr:hypothetical protein FOXG_22297 [Fusarium oxysporum f. sp. lycopersici 4287]KNB18591.1 hypothetical protein FOXG_22297 [Fusarium oxysporum f. sp. lycopersici 4287]
MRSPRTSTFARLLRRALSTRPLSPFVLSHSSIHRSGGSLYRCHPADTLLRCALHSCRCCAIRSHQQSDRFFLTGPHCRASNAPSSADRRSSCMLSASYAMRLGGHALCLLQMLLVSSGSSVASHRNMSHGQRAECVVLLL